MKIIKKLGYVIVAICTVLIFGFVLNQKQESKAADFRGKLAGENSASVSRGGAFS